MMFDLLGSSLKDLFNFCDRKFSLKTVLMLVDQLICRLDYIHFNDLIHRDIKSENCLMSVKKHENQVYVIDLSLATKRRAAQAKANIDRALNSKLVSTARFASVNGHLDVSECNALGSCFSKTNRYSSAASLRWLEVFRIHASLLSSRLSFMTRSHSREPEAKEEAYLDEEENDQYERSVQGPFLKVCDLFRSYPFSWLWRQFSIFLSAQNLSRSLRTREFRIRSCVRLNNSEVSDDYTMKKATARPRRVWMPCRKDLHKIVVQVNKQDWMRKTENEIHVWSLSTSI